MSRHAVVTQIIDGLSESPDLADVPVLPGLREDFERSTYIAVGVLIDGTLSIPTARAGRKDFDDHWTLPLWISVFTERPDGLEWAAQKFSDIFDAICLWLRDNVTGLDGVLSVGGDENEIQTSLRGPGADENGVLAVGSFEIPIHQRLND